MRRPLRGALTPALAMQYGIISGKARLYEGLRLEERHAKSGVRVTTIPPASINAVKNGAVTASNAAGGRLTRGSVTRRGADRNRANL